VALLIHFMIMLRWVSSYFGLRLKKYASIIIPKI
jgi:hypothetical protein